jgi:pimeloyl-ACP methyl ester carboxylesterase
LFEHFKRFVSDKGWLALLMQNIEVKKKSLHWRSNAVLLAESMNEVAGSVNLNKNSVETLLICGSESEFTREEDRSLFTSVYENSTIIEIKEASHWVFVDRPAAFLKEIAMYLK